METIKSQKTRIYLQTDIHWNRQPLLTKLSFRVQIVKTILGGCGWFHCVTYLCKLLNIKYCWGTEKKIIMLIETQFCAFHNNPLQDEYGSTGEG